jgi:hypothetical protein
MMAQPGGIAGNGFPKKRAVRPVIAACELTSQKRVSRARLGLSTITVRETFFEILPIGREPAKEQEKRDRDEPGPIFCLSGI